MENLEDSEGYMYGWVWLAYAHSTSTINTSIVHSSH